MPILPSLPRPERRRMHKIIQTTRDKQHARRVMSILLRYEGYTLKKIHQLTGVINSTDFNSQVTIKSLEQKPVV